MFRWHDGDAARFSALDVFVTFRHITRINNPKIATIEKEF
jgi:hypothetical protein